MSEQQVTDARATLQRFVEAALRTEPDYAAAAQRLQDPRTIRLLHVAMGLVTEAGEFLDMLKKHIIYGKPIDRANAIEELGDITFYERLGVDELDIDYIDMLATNVRKLRLRFPEKFTEENAINRDVTAERALLEAA